MTTKPKQSIAVFVIGRQQNELMNAQVQVDVTRNGEVLAKEERCSSCFLPFVLLHNEHPESQSDLQPPTPTLQAPPTAEMHVLTVEDCEASSPITWADQISEKGAIPLQSSAHGPATPSTTFIVEGRLSFNGNQA